MAVPSPGPGQSWSNPDAWGVPQMHPSWKTSRQPCRNAPYSMHSFDEVRDTISGHGHEIRSWDGLCVYPGVCHHCAISLGSVVCRYGHVSGRRSRPKPDGASAPAAWGRGPSPAARPPAEWRDQKNLKIRLDSPAVPCIRALVFTRSGRKSCGRNVQSGASVEENETRIPGEQRRTGRE